MKKFAKPHGFQAPFTLTVPFALVVFFLSPWATHSKATQLKPAVTIDLEELEREGLGFAHTVVSQQKVPEVKDIPSAEMVKQSASVVMIKKPLYVWHAATGVVVAASVAAFAFWYGRRRRRW